jgi:hypothetical protein
VLEIEDTQGADTVSFEELLAPDVGIDELSARRKEEVDQMAQHEPLLGEREDGVYGRHKRQAFIVVYDVTNKVVPSPPPPLYTHTFHILLLYSVCAPAPACRKRPPPAFRTRLMLR